MALIKVSHSDWWDDVSMFLTGRVVPILAVVAMFMFLFGLGVTLYIAISSIDTPVDNNFSYTSWDGHEYVVMHKEGGWGVTHSPKCKCLPNIEKILQDEKKPGVWMYMDVPVTNLPPMYYNGQPNIMLCGAKE